MDIVSIYKISGNSLNFHGIKDELIIITRQISPMNLNFQIAYDLNQCAIFVCHLDWLIAGPRTNCYSSLKQKTIEKTKMKKKKGSKENVVIDDCSKQVLISLALFRIDMICSSIFFRLSVKQKERSCVELRSLISKLLLISNQQ